MRRFITMILFALVTFAGLEARDSRAQSAGTYHARLIVQDRQYRGNYYSSNRSRAGKLTFRLNNNDSFSISFPNTWYTRRTVNHGSYRYFSEGERHESG